MNRLLTIILAAVTTTVLGQGNLTSDSLRKAYHADMKVISDSFAEVYYPHRPKIYSLNEPIFLKKIDSLQQPFVNTANNYAMAFQTVDKDFIPNEQRDISYFFDRMIVDYPYFHENHTGKKVRLSKSTQSKLNRHLKEFNNPDLLKSKDFVGYVEAFLRHKSTDEVKKNAYKKSDHKRLQAYLNLIPNYFSDQECSDFWQHHYLSAHMDDWGTKNLANIVSKFLFTCKNEVYKKTIDSIYTESTNARKDHLIKTYKTVNGYDLDIHIFLPDSLDKAKRSPVMVNFSGGSWTKGNPEWAFYNCASYAKKGWVGVSVEYRLADRHETTPFEAVKDARSAIRWLRTNADIYNIDTNRIVATGNSAGGHLVLTTALANEWNEDSDNLKYSAAPNLLLVNAGVYDLYAEENTDWITIDLADKSLAKKISPIHLLRKGLPPMLIIHGTNDQSVNYASAKAFAAEMEKLGNDFEFYTLEGAPHAIWFDRRFTG
ncbi:MAG: alpha/beta hydrolase, partial [Bacteroidia bacterium]